MVGALALAAAGAPGPAGAENGSGRPERWSAGVGAGFLASTPDGVEPLFTGHVQYPIGEGLAVGLLVQHAGAGGNDSLLGLSVQVTYGWTIPGTGGAARLVAQGGLGAMWPDIQDDDHGVSDTDWPILVPVGIGLRWTVRRGFAVTADLVLDLVSLGDEVHTSDGDVDLHTNVMPGFYLGVRY